MAFALVLVCAAATSAVAGPVILLSPTYSEPDLDDEAGAIELLYQAALEGKQPGVLAAVPLDKNAQRPLLDRAGDLVRTSGAHWLIVPELDRLGNSLIFTAQIVDENGEIAGKVVARGTATAIAEIASEAARQTIRTTVTELAPLPDVSVGQLRRFAIARRKVLSGELEAAAEALDGADPMLSSKLSSLANLGRSLWVTPEMAILTRLTAAAIAGTPRDTFELSKGNSSPEARAFRALAHISLSDAKAAEAELEKLAESPLVTRARTALADLKHKDREGAFRKLLAGKPSRGALQWLSSLAPNTLPEVVENLILAAGKMTDDPRIAAAIGLRAAEGKFGATDALALISVPELNSHERTRLRAVLKSAGNGFDVQRLNVELAIADAQLEQATVALAELRHSSDARVARYRGRIAWEQADLTTAAVEMKKAGVPYEAARVAYAGGNFAEVQNQVAKDLRASESRLHKMAEAAIAISDGDHARGLKGLREAEVLSPGSADTQQRLAASLLLKGDKEAARRLQARIATMAIPPSAKPLAASKEDEPATATTKKDGAPRLRVGTLEGAQPDPALIDRILMLLGAFPEDALVNRILVLQRYGPVSGKLALKEVNPAPLAMLLRKVLETEPLQSKVVAINAVWPTQPLGEDLMKIAGDNQAHGVLMYQLADNGTVSLILYEEEAAVEPLVVTDELGSGAFGMVQWNSTILIVAGGALAIILLLVMYRVIRGISEFEIRIKLDPSGEREALCVMIAKTDKRFKIGDPGLFRKTLEKGGHQQKGREIQLAGPVSKIRVPPGNWYVHLYGVYYRAGAERILDATFTREATGKRNEGTLVEFDLAPPAAELRVRIHDKKRLGIAVWLDDNAEGRVLTNSEGEAILFVPMGEHQVHVDSEGFRISKQYIALARKVDHLEINLIRERRRAEVSDGLALDGGDAADEDSAIETFSQDRTAGIAAARAPTPDPGPRRAPAPAVTSPLHGGGHGGGHGGALAVGATVGLGSAGPGIPTAAGVAPGPLGASASPGLLCGRYRVMSTLGQGAMGVVYKAHDQNLERTVAVKVLAPELRHHPDAMRFFSEEAKALAQLNHPNIVSVYDQASDENDTYLIMEFVDGRTLDSLLEERGKFPVPIAMALIDQLSSGLAYAHARRVIHRDIKPANIFVSRDKMAKLGDFGLARVMRELSIRKTEIRGTPLYMAPEQITGENVTHRADLYAVGCTFFELLTGRPPFTDGEILYHHLHTEPPKPSSFDPSISADIDELVMDCIAKDADLRVESASAIRERIRQIAK
jgi:hypothetical protein